MAPARTEAERIAVLESEVGMIKQTLRDIDTKLDKLPDKLKAGIEQATARCREMQLAKCNLLHEQRQSPQLKTNSGAAGWVAAVVLGALNGVYLAGKTWGWW